MSDVLKDVSDGEWVAVDCRRIGSALYACDVVKASNQFNVAVAYGRTPEEALANARLMAAAKDMAERLEKINMMACYASEENPEASKQMLLDIGETARIGLKKAGAA